MDNSQVIDIICRWAMICAEEGYDVGTGRSFMNNVIHSRRSGLLRYMLEGNEPHDIPPPRAYSKPWYGLIDSGSEGAHLPNSDVYVITKYPRFKGKVNIVQHFWDILDTIGEEDWVITWNQDRSSAPYRLSRIDESTWHIRPYNKERN